MVTRNRPDTPCRSCGRLLWTNPKSSLPEPMCQPCRRVNPQRHPRKYPKNVRVRDAVCPVCGAEFLAKRWRGRWTVHCSQRCVQAARVHRDPGDHRARRWERIKAAPGLNSTARGRLLARWRRQGRLCAYCPELASTVDHVVPLLRGGTNFEGNLVPACKSCNSAKAWRLLVEWRTGRPASSRWRPVPTLHKVQAPVQLELTYPKPRRLAATHGSAVFYQKGCRCDACWGWYLWFRERRKTGVGVGLGTGRPGQSRTPWWVKPELLRSVSKRTRNARHDGHAGRAGGSRVGSVDRQGWDLWAGGDGVAGDGDGSVATA